MNKFYAVYNGQCYVKGYGRKFYKKGVSFIYVTDCDGKIITEKLNVALTKTLEKCLSYADGTKIKFDAMITNNNIHNISNIKITF